MKFPLHFEVTAEAQSGMSSTWKSKAGNLPEIQMAIPPEFMGPGGALSPEDLFAMSVLNCMIATFKVYAEKAGLSFSQLNAKANLTVDKLHNGEGIAMTHLEFFFNVKGASDPEKMRQVLDRAIQDCAVSKSIQSGKTFHIDIQGHG